MWVADTRDLGEDLPHVIQFEDFNLPAPEDAIPGDLAPATGTGPGNDLDALLADNRVTESDPRVQPSPVEAIGRRDGNGNTTSSVPLNTDWPKQYTVRSGDTLQKISKEFYGTYQKWQPIEAANPDIVAEALVPGVVIAIPQVAAIPADNRGVTRPSDTGGREYIVTDGDNYWTIARDVFGDASRVDELVRLNTIAPHDLRSGNVITLPERSVAVNPQPTPIAARELPGERYHTVAEGELLGDLSKQYYGTATKWELIAAANNISDPGRIQVGARLLIPQDGTTSTPVGPTTTGDREAPTGAGQHYTIEEGDFLGKISTKFYQTSQKWEQILAANPGIDPDNLRVGQKIWIPQINATNTTNSGTTSPRANQPAETTPRNVPQPRNSRPSNPTPPTNFEWPTANPDNRSNSGDSMLNEFWNE